MKADKKTQKITLSFTDAERATIERKASEQKRNVSNYLYLLVLEGLNNAK